MDGSNAEQARRQAAEARRQKILARQKDRLSSITGVYAKSQGDEAAGAEQQHAAVAAGGIDAAGLQSMQEPSTAAAVMEASTDDAELQQQQQQLAALMAAVGDSLQRAQAASRAADGASCGQEHMQLAPAAEISAAVDREIQQQSMLEQMLQEPQQQQQQQQQAPLVTAVLQLGPVLAAAVKQTQLIRLLSTLILAYAALAGWHSMGLPPMLLVIATNLSIIAAAAVLLQSSPAAQMLLTQQRDEAKMPWRLRSFDFLSLVPGLRDLMSALSGYQQVFKSVSEDVAAFVVLLGLLVVTAAVSPQLA